MRASLLAAMTTAALGLGALAHPAAAQYAGYGQGGYGQSYGGGIAGGLQPSVGTGTRVGDIRPQLEAYYARNTPAPSATGPALVIQPSLGVDVGFTDNAQRAASPRRADVFTLITPSISVSRDAARLKLNANYSPTLSVYASQSNQTRLSQTGDARALAILVPDELFLDVRGSISQSSLLGNGYGTANSTTNYNRQNQVTSYTASVSPYAQHRFGGWGVGRIGYVISRTTQDAEDGQVLIDNGFNSTGVGPFGTQAYGSTGNLTTQTERASFSSGENLGRFNDTLVVSATQYSGSGSYRGAHRNEANNELGFALTRTITLLGGIGYQDLKFSGTPSYRLQEPTYNVGVRYAPNPDTTVTVLYGRRDGAPNLSFDGQFAPTAQTRLIGRYSTGITSDLQEAQDILSSTSVGSVAGSLSDTGSGVPVASGGISGTQNGIYRVKRLSVVGLLLRPRDSYSISVTSEDRTTLTSSTSLLTNAVVPAGTSTSSIYTSASWQHDLSQDMNTSVSAQYGTTNSTSQLLGAGASTQRTISLSAVLSKQFTATLSGSLRYTFTDQSGGTATNSTVFNPVLGRTFNTGAYTENLFLVGLRKSF